MRERKSKEQFLTLHYEYRNHCSFLLNNWTASRRKKVGFEFRITFCAAVAVAFYTFFKTTGKSVCLQKSREVRYCNMYFCVELYKQWNNKKMANRKYIHNFIFV